jgi:hypothetical protein
MSQTQPNAHLFQLGHDNIAIEELLVLGTGLGIAAENKSMPVGTRVRLMTKIGPKLNLCPHRHFTEKIAGMFKKQPF